MANNKDTIKDGYGENSDWIELHNPSLSEVNLAGLFLTDDRNNLRKWSFPEEAKINSGAYLLSLHQANLEIALKIRVIFI